MRKILVISPDKLFLRALRWTLEEAGYLTVLSDSLEQSFFEADQTDPHLVIIDSAALTSQPWQLQKFLSWFRHRSPVLLLTSEQAPTPEFSCDGFLPKRAAADQLLGCIQKLRR